MEIQTKIRNASLDEIVPALQEQHDVKLDAVLPFTAMRSEGGVLRVGGLSAVDITDELSLRPTSICDAHLAEKLGVPTAYLRKLRDERVDLYDANVNGWIHGRSAGNPDVLLGTYDPIDPDRRRVLLRAFHDADEPGSEGIARSILSDTYKPIDHLDVLFTALSAVKETGIECRVTDARLSEERMTVIFNAPSLRVAAPILLEGYRSPFGAGRYMDVVAKAVAEGKPYDFGNPDTINERWARVNERLGRAADDTDPMISCGFSLTNGENGGSAFTIEPFFYVLWCLNGGRIKADAVRRIHLGEKLGDGIVRYSDETKAKAMELVLATTGDAVKTFLDEEYWTVKVREIEEKAGAPVTDAVETVKLVATKLSFTETEQKGILDFFINGGTPTAGGVMQAVTAFAQTVDDPDRAWELEGAGLDALALASS